AVEMHINKVQSGRCTPMTEQPGLHMLKLQRLTQQRVGEQVDLPDRKIISGAPIVIHFAQLFRGKGLSRNRELGGICGCNGSHRDSSLSLYYGFEFDLCGG